MHIGCHICILHIWIHFQVQWQMQKQSESIPQLCQILQNITHVPVDRWRAALQSLVWLVVYMRGNRLQPLKGNTEPLQATKTAKSSLKCIEHLHKHRCAHTGFACFRVPKHTQTYTWTPLTFLSILTFVLAGERADCLLLWSWPSWSGSLCPNSVGEVWNQSSSVSTKTTASAGADRATESTKSKLLTHCSPAEYKVALAGLRLSECVFHLLPGELDSKIVDRMTNIFHFFRLRPHLALAVTERVWMDQVTMRWRRIFQSFKKKI